MSIFGSPPPPPQISLPPTPAAPPPPPAFGMVQGQKPGRKPQAATFLGTGDIGNLPGGLGPASGQLAGGKTLLGV